MKKRYRSYILLTIVFVPILLMGFIYTSFAGANGETRIDAPASATAIIGDDFNACVLDTDIWTFTDPDGDSTMHLDRAFEGDARLVIEVPADAQHTISPSRVNAPRVMQPAPDEDFVIQAKFKSHLEKKYQIQGILIEGAPDEFIRFDFFSTISGTLETHIYAATLVGGVGGVFDEKNDDIIPNLAPVGESYFMRIERNGDQWTQSYSYKSIGPWIKKGSFEYVTTVSAVGVYAGNSGNTAAQTPAHTALVDYFFPDDNKKPPGEDEDLINDLTVNKVGMGSVVKTPDLTNYACFQAVQLEANADPGWSFTGWSGDLSGTTNPETISMTGGQVITATFTEDQYTLTTATNGAGSVTAVPDKPTYTLGEVVTLTANADPGSSFATWSGDLSGSDNPITLVMNGNKSVTANFTEDQYTLTINTNGDGSVTADPDKPNYKWGDVVKLTANANPGSSFVGWSGDLSGSVSPKTLVMNANKVVEATFTRDQYTVTITTPEGNGVITKVPDKTFYEYDEEISFTATPDASWAFEKWSGDLSGGDNPKTLKVTGNHSVSAVFAQNLYTLGTAAVGSGKVTRDPDQAAYELNDVVTLTAVPTPGWTFDSWSGDLSGSDNPKTLVMDGNKSVTATFKQNQQQIFLPLVTRD